MQPTIDQICSVGFTIAPHTWHLSYRPTAALVLGAKTRIDMAATMRGSPDMAPHIANGARRAPGSRKNRAATPSDENYEYEEQEDSNTSHRSTKGTGASGLGRSFSTRAQDYPEENLNHTTRKPVPPLASEELDDSTTPRNLPTEDYPSGPIADMPQIQQPIITACSRLGSPSQPVKHHRSDEECTKRLGIRPITSPEAGSDLDRNQQRREAMQKKKMENLGEIIGC